MAEKCCNICGVNSHTIANCKVLEQAFALKHTSEMQTLLHHA